jgi:hypothetical protein
LFSKRSSSIQNFTVLVCEAGLHWACRSEGPVVRWCSYLFYMDRAFQPIFFARKEK